MRQLYHFSRKRRMLKFRLKQFSKLDGQSEPGVIRRLLTEIRRLAIYADRSLMKRIALMGLLVLLGHPAGAQENLYLEPSRLDTSAHLLPYNHLIVDTVIAGDTLGLSAWYMRNYNIEFVDVDNDGDEDALYSVGYYCYDDCVFPPTSAIVFQENISDEDPKFGYPVVLFEGSSWYYALSHLNAGDLDGDGDLDIVFSFFSDSTLLFENTAGPGGGFDLTIRNGTALSSAGLLVFAADLADIDLDGDLDLVTIRNTPDNSALEIAYIPNNPSAGFASFQDTVVAVAQMIDLPSPSELVSGLPFFNQVSLLDMDDDGDQDLIYQCTAQEDEDPSPSYYNRERRVYFLENTAGSGFVFDAPAVQLFETDLRDDLISISEYSQFDAADFDKDGDIDFLESRWKKISGCSYCESFTYRTGMFYRENVSGEAVLTGKVFADINSNSILDGDDRPAANISVQHQPSGAIHVTDNTGGFVFRADSGSQDIIPLYGDPLWQVAPTSRTIDLDSLQAVDSLDFALQPTALVSDLRINVVGGSWVRPGYGGNFILTVTNDGTVPADPVVSAVLSDQLQFLNADPPPASTGDTLRWTVPQLYYQERFRFILRTQVSTSSQIGDTLTSYFQVEPVAGDPTPGNNSWVSMREVRSSHDPNDKSVYPPGSGTEGAVPPDTDLFTYTIRFQNVGNDTAFTVVVIDTIDTDLDPLTFRMVTASHDYDFELLNRVATWTFDDILLPDSTTDQEGSNGFIQYDIKPYPGLPAGSVFTNAADIYFDSNAPVRTNETHSTYVIPLGTGADQLLEFQLYPNPTAELAVLEFRNEHHSKASLEVYDASGKLVLMDEVYDGSFEIRRGDLPPGMYTFRVRVNGIEGAGKLGIGG